MPFAHPAQWRDDDYDVLEKGVVVGRIFCLDAVGPQGRPWMWASGHNGHICRAAHGYEPTREALIQLDAARHVQRSRGGGAGQNRNWFRPSRRVRDRSSG
jgi:hypothetical protein